MAQTFSRLPVTPKAGVQAQADVCRTLLKQRNIWTRFSLSTSVFLCHYQPTNASYSFLCHRL